MPGLTWPTQSQWGPGLNRLGEENAVHAIVGSIAEHINVLAKTLYYINIINTFSQMTISINI